MEQRRGHHALRHRGEAANVAEENGHPLFLATERELAGFFPVHDRARDGGRDEASERVARARQRDLLLDLQIPEEDHPPEPRREHVRDRGNLDRTTADGAGGLEREHDVRTDDVRGEEAKGAEEPPEAPAQDEQHAGKADDQEDRERCVEALLQHRVAVREDRLRRVGPDLDAEHLVPARVRHRVVVRDRRQRVRADEDGVSDDQAARGRAVDDVLHRHDAELGTVGRLTGITRIVVRDRRGLGRVIDRHSAAPVERHRPITERRGNDEQVALAARAR